MPNFYNLQQVVFNSEKSEFPYKIYREIAANCFMLMTFLEHHCDEIHYGDVAREFASASDVFSLEDDKLIAEARLCRVIDNELRTSATRNQFSAGLRCLSYLSQVRPLPGDKVEPLARLERDILSLL
ncbi:hypothetical protein [Methylobacterium sp. NFXW15]|uniref:hypothetical protein n=1 Tax=Methylobacterium sp. NFXW15 TaxID=2819512 RepID=UPI003CF0B139